MTRYLSIKNKIYLLTMLLIIFTALGSFSLHVHQMWLEMQERQFQQLESLTVLLDKRLDSYQSLLGTAQPFLHAQRTATDQEALNQQAKKQLIYQLNRQLQPEIEQILSSFPGYGAGYYNKRLNSIRDVRV